MWKGESAAHAGVDAASTAVMVEGVGDQQGASRDSLGSRATTTVSVVLVGLAAIAWIITVKNAADMGSMVNGLGQIGARMPNDMAVPLFMAMWLAMMVAMMFPTVIPIVLAHRMVVQKRGEGWLPTASFVAGYIAVWTAIGVVPLLAFLGFRNLMDPPPGWVVPVAGLVLVFAGVYQFTPVKGVCLSHCRSPLHFIMTHDFGRGSRGAMQAGASHGAWCLGCCWALMSVLVVVGLMNLVWMVALALVFLLEKNWRYGVIVSRAAGAGVALLGILVLVQPQTLGLLAGTHT
jgi:predicted metal-binding membrane protein